MAPNVAKKSNSKTLKRNKSIASNVKRLKKIIENDCAKYSLSYKLQKNEGIITNNILHGRKAFKDDKVKRKLLRIRSYERL